MSEAASSPGPTHIRPCSPPFSHRELRKSLRALSGFSLATTRRLDDTYYSILEKVASLRSAIGGLQELLDLTKQLRDEFQTDTDELEADVQGQTDGFGGFSMQRGRIEELEARIKAGREKANGLSDRLETVRQRVEVRRRVEGEWQAQSSRKPPEEVVCMRGLLTWYGARSLQDSIRSSRRFRCASSRSGDTSPLAKTSSSPVRKSTAHQRYRGHISAVCSSSCQGHLEEHAANCLYQF